MTKAVTPQEAQAHLPTMMQVAAQSHEPVVIETADPDLNTVLVNQHDWEAMQETLNLVQSGSLAVVRHRLAEDGDWSPMELSDNNW